MSNIYFVRHGQAGTRDDYDALSDLGKRQARLLGEHFVSQGIQFASAFVGALSRQHQTAEQISAAYTDAQASFPVLTVDPGWNEFDLGRVYSELAPVLSSEDIEFKREYEEMRRQVETSLGVQDASIHRKWMPCDTKLVEAWIRGRYPYGGETWEQFRERVAACRTRICDSQQRENILVVTSATPIAVWTGLSLEIRDERLMRLAGALYNASYTVMRLRRDELRLFTFNAATHLSAAGLRTHR